MRPMEIEQLAQAVDLGIGIAAEREIEMEHHALDGGRIGAAVAACQLGRFTGILHISDDGFDVRRREPVRAGDRTGAQRHSAQRRGKRCRDNTGVTHLVHSYLNPCIEAISRSR